MVTLIFLAGFFCTLGKITAASFVVLVMLVGINYKRKVLDYVKKEQEAEMRAKEAEKELAETMQDYSECPTLKSYSSN